MNVLAAVQEDKRAAQREDAQHLKQEFALRQAQALRNKAAAEAGCGHAAIYLPARAHLPPGVIAQVGSPFVDHPGQTTENYAAPPVELGGRDGAVPAMWQQGPPQESENPRWNPNYRQVQLDVAAGEQRKAQQGHRGLCDPPAGIGGMPCQGLGDRHIQPQPRMAPAVHAVAYDANRPACEGGERREHIRSGQGEVTPEQRCAAIHVCPPFGICRAR